MIKFILCCAGWYFLASKLGVIHNATDIILIGVLGFVTAASINRIAT